MPVTRRACLASNALPAWAPVRLSPEARMSARRMISALALAALALTAGAGTARACPTGHTHPLTRADKSALKWADRVCDAVTDDVTYEACVTGGVQAKRTRYVITAGVITSVRARAFGPDDYESGPVITADAGTHPVGHKVHPASKADRRALTDAEAQCADLGDTDPDLMPQCVLGAFTMTTGRVLTKMDVTWSPWTRSFALQYGSHHIL